MAKTSVLLLVVFGFMCCVNGLVSPPQYWDRGCGGDPNAKWSDNYMPLCEPSCEIPNHQACYYLSNQHGCTCKDGFYRSKAGQCVTLDECYGPNPGPYNPYYPPYNPYYPPSYPQPGPYYPQPDPYNPMSIYQPYYQPTQPSYPDYIVGSSAPKGLGSSGLGRKLLGGTRN